MRVARCRAAHCTRHPLRPAAHGILSAYAELGCLYWSRCSGVPAVCIDKRVVCVAHGLKSPASSWTHDGYTRRASNIEPSTVLTPKVFDGTMTSGCSYIQLVYLRIAIVARHGICFVRPRTQLRTGTCRLTCRGPSIRGCSIAGARATNTSRDRHPATSTGREGVHVYTPGPACFVLLVAELADWHPDPVMGASEGQSEG